MSFGVIIKKLRIEKEWTQEYVANKLNISVGALSRYETGMYEPKSLDLVKDFANLFCVSTDYLLGKTDIRQPITQLNFEKHLLNSKFAEKYNKLTDDQKKTLDSLVEVWDKENKMINNIEKLK